MLRRTKNPVPVQTDEVVEQKNVETTLWRSELVGMVLFFILAGIALVRLFPIRYNNFLSFSGVVGTYWRLEILTEKEKDYV